MTGHELSLQMMREVLEDAAKAGYSSVRLYGGEPLLHPQLAEMISHARMLALEPYVTTNAILLGRRVDELFDAGLRSVTFGYYGSGSRYDRYVDRREAHRRLTESIGTVRRRYGKRLFLRMNWLLMRPTCSVEAVDEMWEFARRFEVPVQVDLIHYSLPYFTEGEDRWLQLKRSDLPEIQLVVDRLLEFKSERPDLVDHSSMGLRSIPEWLTKGPDMKVPCDKYEMIWIGADGTVQLCYVTFKLGNLHERRLRDMLFAPEHKASARAAFRLDCPNCHCGYDERVQKHRPSRARFGP